MNAFYKDILRMFNGIQWRSRIRSRLASIICALLCLALTACTGNIAGETAFTTAQGPADSALPYQAVFAVDKDADERLIAAAQGFCDRTAELSRGGAVFSLVRSENALQDLKSGKADAILLENAEISSFSPLVESFRYKSYEHFAMTANADSTLQILSDILDANAFAGFYAGSDIFLSRGTLDSKFRPLPRKGAEDARDAQAISVAAISDSTARAFTLLNGEASVINELNGRIHACSLPNSITEFSYPELNTPALLAVLLETASVASIPLTESPAASDDDIDDDGEDTEVTEPAPTEPAQTDALTATPAFTGIKPVWLVFAPDIYEKLSQTNRAAADEAVAYMVSDIDGVYLAYEREILAMLADVDIVISDEFAATRALALRLADEQAERLPEAERKLREAVAKIQ